MAAFWLAAKLEEVIEIDNPHRLTVRGVVTVIDRVTRRRDGHSVAVMDPYSQKYEELKQLTVQAERYMLRAFGFVVHVEHPHRFILNYCQMLMKPSDERQHALQQEAWNMANDSLRTTLCVRYRAEAVACGILFTAARKLQISLPEDPPWWALFEVKEAELVDVCRTLCDLYRQPRARHLPVGRPASAPAVGAPGARSPLSAQPTPPLRSPATGARSIGGASAAAAEAAPATAAPRSDGEAPSVAQQDGETEGEKDKVKSKEKEGDSRWRRRSRSRSRSHGRSHRSQRRDSRSRSPRDRQKRSRSSGRSASASRSASRSPPACSPGRDRRPSPPRDRRPSPRRDRRPSPRRDRSRHDDLPIYRPGGRSDRRSNRGDRRRDERDYRGGSRR
ncbi:cyclin-L1-1-like [Micractinium conductrix]|uniref:Cyclin-L1-1-like n=1 Tax=Micractinium conductrix TaxID=554055 RepID=A0A2P6VCS5_9CHLO|nr:cyclin-L1-1-like [Micractinium conductrix]|eukprot:PSC71895.1 cyclin-L1-1-like [Micractinium conductrix]